MRRISRWFDRVTAVTGSVFGLAFVIVALALISLVLCVVTIGLMIAIIQFAAAL